MITYSFGVFSFSFNVKIGLRSVVFEDIPILWLYKTISFQGNITILQPF